MMWANKRLIVPPPAKYFVPFKMRQGGGQLEPLYSEIYIVIYSTFVVVVLGMITIPLLHIFIMIYVN